MHCHIGVGSHNLLFGGQLGALLELKVTDGTGQGEVAIDTAEVDEATRGTDAGLLACRRELAYHAHGMRCSLFSCSPAGCNWEKKKSKDTRVQTFVLRLVVEGERLCAAFDAQY